MTCNFVKIVKNIWYIKDKELFEVYLPRTSSLYDFKANLVRDLPKQNIVKLTLKLTHVVLKLFIKACII